MLVKIRSGVAIALLLGASAVVNAAGLGKLTVNSALGQVLAAEIDLVSLQPGELDALTARVASPDAYRDAKIEYSAVLRQLRFSVQKRANGQPYLKLTSESPLNEPFLDVLIEVTWPAGRLQREYPILLDPPGFAQSRSVAPVAAATAPAAAAAPPAVPASSGPSAKAEMAAAKPSASPGDKTYGPVKKGDTLRKIAGEVKPESVSLEQMLAALYRENKSAFSGNNMNRLKAGQILRVPMAEEAEKIGIKDARQEIQAHVTDWKAYREQLAGAVSTLPATPSAPQQAAGSVSGAAVAPPPSPAPASADVLKLSKTEAAKAGTKGAAAQDRVNALQEEIIARDKALKEAQSRVADLEKQVRDLQRLIDLRMGAPAKAPEAAKAPDTKVAAVKPAETKAPEPAKAAEPPKAAESAKPAEAPAVKPAEPAKAAEPPKAEPPKAAKAPAKAPPPPPEPELMDQIMENLPLVAGGAGAIGLLGLGGFMLARRRKGKAEAAPVLAPASSAFPSDLKPGKGGGELVDTDNSSFLTDFEKTGPGTVDTNEVDPVAEAEVYIAYGRDTQAEEILKEAMTRDSTRHEISLKLLEIYHARKSATAFETVARQLHDSVGDASAIWHKAAAMGAQIDPANPLYGGVAPAELAEPVEPAAKPDLDFDLGTAVGGPAETQQIAPVSLDFDLGPAGASDSAAAPDAVAAKEGAPKNEKPSFDIDLSSLEFAPAPASEDPATPATTAPDLDLTFPSAPATPAAEAAPGGLDLTDLNLDAPISEPAVNPMTTKLELAKAYLEIGDKDGAREILQEVAKAGSAAQQDEAQKLIASL
jgi:pilus assembly protein FimV